MIDPARLDRYSDMDEEETEATNMSVHEYERWVAAGRPDNFFADPQEMNFSRDIEVLYKMSMSYQRRHNQ